MVPEKCDVLTPILSLIWNTAEIPEFWGGPGVPGWFTIAWDSWARSCEFDPKLSIEII